eukprot:TRINITY_DN546_c0_g1_i4.p2 TRINITY_DN546_c0_g1~~TRINITY_DN546_c0_g1_i4.p2  ORF type:complete len:181 (+),score=23.12 TRINITY_DN546_c0_g1_i4:68-610(+)
MKQTEEEDPMQLLWNERAAREYEIALELERARYPAQSEAVDLAVQMSKSAPVLEQQVALETNVRRSVDFLDPVSQVVGDSTDFMKGCVASMLGGPLFYVVALWYGQKRAMHFGAHIGNAILTLLSGLTLILAGLEILRMQPVWIVGVALVALGAIMLAVWMHRYSLLRESVRRELSSREM